MNFNKQKLLLITNSLKGTTMQDFSIQAVGNQAVITVDLSFMDIDSLNRIFERMRTEQLIRKAGFPSEIIELGSEIKQDWWKKNRDHYLKGVVDADCD